MVAIKTASGTLCVAALPPSGKSAWVGGHPDREPYFMKEMAEVPGDSSAVNWNQEGRQEPRATDSALVG